MAGKQAKDTRNNYIKVHESEYETTTPDKKNPPTKRKRVYRCAMCSYKTYYTTNLNNHIKQYKHNGKKSNKQCTQRGYQSKKKWTKHKGKADIDKGNHYPSYYPEK